MNEKTHEQKPSSVARRKGRIRGTTAILLLLCGIVGLDSATALAATPILGPTQSDAGSAQKWATRRNATREFVDLAPLFWQIAPTRGGVRPEVAYAQSALETGYGRFGGAVDASYHNPCGLKTRYADGDDPEDHKRFPSWSEGITACVDHLALYAGAAGYPRQDTPDERHFSYLFGRAPTVEALGGSWAPSPDYGNQVASLLASLMSESSWDPGVPVLLRFDAYDAAFTGGVFVAGGNIDTTAGDEIVTGAGAGGGPHVRVLGSAGGAIVDRGGFLAYSPGFTGGVRVAAGDVDADGKDEIVTGPGPGGGPHVTVRKRSGNGYVEMAGFYAYDAGFVGGTWVAAGNVDGRAGDEVITGAGAGGGPHIVVWRYTDGRFTPLGGFYAYSPDFLGGVTVGTADIDGDGNDEILTGAGAGGGPHVNVFEPTGTRRASFFVYTPLFTGGVMVAGHGARVAFGTGAGSPHVWSAQDSPLPATGPQPHTVDLAAYAFAPTNGFGARLAVADFDTSRAGSEVAVSQGSGTGPAVRVLAAP